MCKINQTIFLENKVQNVIIMGENDLIKEGIKSIIKESNLFSIRGNYKIDIDIQKIKAENFTCIYILLLDSINSKYIETIKKIKAINKENLILTITQVKKEESLNMIVSAGIDGCILKSTSGKDLVRALNLISTKKKFYSEDLIPMLTNRLVRGKSIKQQNISFSKREFEVLQLIAKGFSSQEIAQKLNISKKTVANHRASLNGKAGVKNTASLISFAMKNHIIDL
ncbi:MAG: response regulator transcription factor [Bacteroidales bacterium]